MPHAGLGAPVVANYETFPGKVAIVADRCGSAIIGNRRGSAIVADRCGSAIIGDRRGAAIAARRPRGAARR
jgi:hypothetical protein